MYFWLGIFRLMSQLMKIYSKKSAFGFSPFQYIYIAVPSISPRFLTLLQCARFNMPNHFSPPVTRLIRKFLDPNPQTRVTLPQLKQDPWFSPPELPKIEISMAGGEGLQIKHILILSLSLSLSNGPRLGFSSFVLDPKSLKENLCKKLLKLQIPRYT